MGAGPNSLGDLSPVPLSCPLLLLLPCPRPFQVPFPSLNSASPVALPSLPPSMPEHTHTLPPQRNPTQPGPNGSPPPPSPRPLQALTPAPLALSLPRCPPSTRLQARDPSSDLWGQPQGEGPGPLIHSWVPDLSSVPRGASPGRGKKGVTAGDPQARGPPSASAASFLALAGGPWRLRWLPRVGRGLRDAPGSWGCCPGPASLT
ncbi:hypothetical protein MC885_020782 [Smutsia gigantea]|nr:hypothetical protein MC885_020782 [Smutsia gigantea]